MDHRTSVLVFLALLLVKDGASVEMTITPDNPTETIDHNVIFSCNLGQNTADYHEIYVMDIIKDSKTQIAIVRSNGIEFKHDAMKQRFEAHGLVSGAVSQSYLNLTLLLPRVEDSGTYSCVISYLDASGLVRQERDTATLVVKKLKLTKENYVETVVHSLLRRVEVLEKFKEEKDQQKQDLENSMKKQKDDLMKKINALEKKVSYKSVFSATLKAKNARTTLSAGTTIIFDEVTERQGQGYDEKTGVFTAKKKGLYAFHLFIGTWSQKTSFTDIDLTVNGQAKARLQTTNYNSNLGGNQDQTEITLVTVLDVGDKVSAVPGSDTTSAEQMIANLCSFSGYLIRAYD